MGLTPHFQCYILFLTIQILLKAKLLGLKDQVFLLFYKLIADMLSSFRQGPLIQEIMVFAEPNTVIDNGGSYDKMFLEVKNTMKLLSASDEYDRYMAVIKNRLHIISDYVQEQFEQPNIAQIIPKTNLFCYGAIHYKYDL